MKPWHFPWPGPLLEGVLVQRRDRFLADIALTDGRTIVAHCVNTGRMEGLTLPGRRVWVTPRPEGVGKLRYTWMLAERPEGLIGADTSLPNRLVWKMLSEGVLPGHADEEHVRREVPWHDGRVDFWLGRERATLIEVKNCHLVYPDGYAYFPDSVSERATKHLRSLLHAIQCGHAAEVLFVIQCEHAKAIRPSDAHDPAFAETLREVTAKGVRVRALHARPTLSDVVVERTVPVDVAPYSLAEVRGFREALRAEAPAWVQSPRRPSAKQRQ